MMKPSQQHPGAGASPNNQLHFRKKIYFATKIQFITDALMLFLAFVFYCYLFVTSVNPDMQQTSTSLPELHNKTLWTISPTQKLLNNATIHEKYKSLVRYPLISPLIRIFILTGSFATTMKTVDADLPLPRRLWFLAANIVMRVILGLVDAIIIIEVEIYNHVNVTAIANSSILYVYAAVQILYLLDSIVGFSKIIIWIKKCERLEQVEQMAMASMAESLVSLA
ncbi:hypothetical protein L5515_012290 [Caenorhabditis briggsae]|uniref:Uncharacterized protein n=1 Tax=Caenorhabditis briggsae TaxID=6238 RepID=A0AAE9JGV5_CAEBR|nr:hypothetical protein L5515_012290 [Caenorhabditis briggsae]